MEEVQWKIVVQSGKDTLEIEIPPPPTTPAWLTTLQDTVAQHSGVAVAHQKLVFRGKQLTISHAKDLKPGSKLMLLKNAAFYRTAATKASPTVPSTEENEVVVAPPAAPVSQRLDIDVNDIDEDHVLLQATRGKAVYEFLFHVSTRIEDVKARVGGAMGLSGAAIRLIIKGKTPTDGEQLVALVGTTTRVVKSMVLLRAGQYDRLDREEEFRVIQNELTVLHAQIEKLSRVMQRNILVREEVLLQLHVLEDRISSMIGNLEIIEDQLKANRLVERDSTTFHALQNARQEATALKMRTESLAHAFKQGR